MFYAIEVVSWGHDESGGDATSVEGQLVEVRQVVGAVDSFAALKQDDTVITW